jgi:hypothetical protein
MTKKEREQFETIQRMTLLIANGLVFKQPAQVRAAAKALAEECGVQWPKVD